MTVHEPVVGIGGRDVQIDARERSSGPVAAPSAVDGFVSRLAHWNRATAVHADQRGFHEWFSEQAARCPDAVAVRGAGSALTYAELDQRSDRLARGLLACGMEAETRVGIALRRSPSLVVALLAVLKAGGCFVPLDPKYPRERLRYMIERTKMSLLLSETVLVADLPIGDARLVCIDEPWPEPADPIELPRVLPEQLAYVMFTSGSTGQPKGVQISHRGLMNELHGAVRDGLMSPADVVLATVTICFDPSIFELFLPLVLGASVVVASDRDVANPQRLAKLLGEERVTVLQATPVIWRMLLEHGFEVPKGFRGLLGGEALPGVLAAKLMQRGIVLHNCYGPTETTIWATWHKVTADDRERAVVQIGMPIDGIGLYVLDERLEPVGPNVVGELYIGGVGLGRGYFDQPGLSATRFVPMPDSLGGPPGERLYRTGDLCRVVTTDEGEIARVDFLGRADWQVKLRGHRIELDEIRHVLLKHDNVRQAVVTVYRPEEAEPRLVAYVVPLAEEGGKETHDQSLVEQIEQWQRVWSTTYASGAAGAQPDLNTVGWHDHYTNLPIPIEHMQIWVDATCARIVRDIGPKVLEIGCGTGMLLLRLATRCAAYVATDISQVALRYVADIIDKRNEYAHVELLERGADDFSGLADDFDVVVLNSVIQYFPSVSYLLRVIEGALARVRPGGALFIGDVRNGALLEVLHAAVQLFRAGDEVSVAELRRNIDKQLVQEQELTIDPEFFHQLAQRFPRISGVDIRLKRGRHSDIVTQFRYDVTLHVDRARPAAAEVSWREWPERSWDIESLRTLLKDERPDLVGFANVANARVAREAALVELLAAEEGPRDVGGLRAGMDLATGLHPEDLWSLGDELGYDVEVGWARERPEAMDVVFRRLDAPWTATMAARGGREPQVLLAYGNDPLQGKVAAWLEPRLRVHAAEFLPDYMRPQNYVVLGELPLTPNGKVNVKALPVPGVSRPNLPTAMVRPRNAMESRLAAIWRKVLRLETVGVDDNFMDLGGTSILLTQIYDQVLSEFGGAELTIVDMFRFPTVRTLAEYLDKVVAEQPASARRRSPRVRGHSKVSAEQPYYLPPRDQRPTDIAIIGMSCRLPGADNLREYWRNLVEGVESISFFSPDEMEPYEAGVVAQPNHVRAAAVIRDVEQFDADFFGYSEREAELIDPQQRVFLECAWEALEDAGYTSEGCEGLVGVFAGSGLNTYLINNVHPSRGWSMHRTFLSTALDLQIRLGNDKDHMATRVSYKLDLRGPSVVVQTACSTSLVAVHNACQAILEGECDMAIAGCMNIILPQKVGYLYEEGMMFSPDGHCRAFDAHAQGTLFGNGGGAVVLKRLADAMAAGDEIYAVIKGSAVNNDGSMKVGYSAPAVEGQAAVIHDAMEAAGVRAETITYVETHGTGTVLGDPIEVAGLTQAWAWAGGAGENRCALGSVKTNLGHLTEAAGIAGLIKVALALQHRQIPATLHFKQPNPRIDFASGPFFVNTELRAWEQPLTLAAEGLGRRAGVSSFGMGGTNAHAVLEEAPRRVERPAVVAPRLLVLSARDAVALREQVVRCRTYLDRDPSMDLAELCFTYATGRQHFDVRIAFVAESRAELCRQMDEYLAAGSGARAPGGVCVGSGHAVGQGSSPRKIGLLFTGQGAQERNMGRQLYEDWPAFREALDRCDVILRQHIDRPLLEALFAGDEGQASELDQTMYAQPALFSMEYALYRLWETLGVVPDVVMGHSVGEYVAACVAGVFELEDALALIAGRGRLMQALPRDGAMAAVDADPARIAALLHGREDELAIAALNGPGHTVISGRRSALLDVCEGLQRDGARTRMLRVSHAFHSPLMRPMVEDFRRQLDRVRFRQPRIPIVANLSGTLAGEAMTSPEYWVRHVLEPVRFADGCRSLAEQQVDVLIEAGPRPVLLGMAASILTEPQTLFLPSLASGHGDTSRVLTSVANLHVHGVAVNLPAIFRQQFGPRRPARRHVPTYPFQRRRHWIDPPSMHRGEPVTVQTAAGAERRTASAGPPVPSGAPTLRQRLETTPQRNRRRLLMDEVRNIVATLLGTSAVDADKGFFESGMDSLTSILLRNNLQTALACELPRTIAFTYSNVTTLVDHLLERVLALPAEPHADRKKPDGANGRLLDEIESLSEEEAAALLVSQLRELNES